ncbi:MAG TPA: NHL repeat-containing protein [Ktedonobacteraceae bacterium]
MQRTDAGRYKKQIGKGVSVFLLTWITICSTLGTPAPVLAAGVSPAALTVYGQAGSFTTNTNNKGGISANSLSTPGQIAIDPSGNVYITDSNNNRVLFFPGGSTTATRVYGQAGSFTTSTNNKGGVSANSLSHPGGVALDSSNNLYIADSNNNRVLFFPSGSTTATRVYGQGGSFTTNFGNKGGVTADSQDGPVGLLLDHANNLYVADTENNRVLFYLSGSTTATGVYGQGGAFNSSNANHGSLGPDSLSGPSGIALDGGGNLYIADANNNRALFIPSGSTTATRVYGQGGNFTINSANTGGISANSLDHPTDVALDAGDNLYIADTSNNRTLFFPNSSTTATRVYGQAGSFTTNSSNSGGVSASTLQAPAGVLVNNNNGTIFLSDSGNNRVLTFQTSLRVTTQPPASVAATSPFTIAASLFDVGSNSVFADASEPVFVSIKTGSGSPGAILGGTTLVAAVNGVATFSNLSIDRSGSGYILTVSSPGVNAADTNAFTVIGSLLFIPLSSPSFSFTLNGSPGIATGQRTLEVRDTTQSGVGWHLTITSTQFTASGGRTLPLTATKITQVTAACTAGQTCLLPTNTVSGYPLTVPAGSPLPPALTYFRAAGGTGTGSIRLTVTYTLSIPPGTAAGTYTSTFTEALVKGP